MQRALNDVLRLAASAPTLVAWRKAALGWLRLHIKFDVAVFHELSPRMPPSRAALIGINAREFFRESRHWDENAVAFGHLRELALQHGGVASDDQAFPPRSRGRQAWQQRVARPLALRAVVIGHLIVRNRIIGVVLLGRRRGPCFSDVERRALARCLPALSVGDALLQSLETERLGGAQAVLQCVDQRLTPRQREVVVHVALGQTNAQIGHALDISHHTVRNLLAQVCARLGAANRAEVVRLAVMQLA